MHPQDPLAALHPLREPALIGWWPPAPGWWLALALALCVLGVLVHALWRRHRRSAYRRQALRQLEQIEEDFRRRGDARQSLTAINALLKSVALKAYPRPEVAASSGESWIGFLNDCLRPEEAFPPEFGSAVYAPQSGETDPRRILESARSWIRRHREPSR